MSCSNLKTRYGKDRVCILALPPLSAVVSTELCCRGTEEEESIAARLLLGRFMLTEGLLSRVPRAEALGGVLVTREETTGL